MKLGKKWLVLWLLLPSVPNNAEPAEVTKIAVWSGFSLLDFDYEEFTDSDSTANSEEGLLPGIAAGVSVTTTAGLLKQV